MTVLSVVVPTIPGRESLLSRCLHSITDQRGDYEVIVVAGTGPLGTKYNTAVEAAHGSYVTCVDDDDWLTGSYMADVLPLCAEDVDYVGLKIMQTVSGRFNHVRATSAESKTWINPRGRHALTVYPTQLTVPKGVTRKSIAAQVTYQNYSGADMAWAKEVSPLVESWRFVDRVLYMYDYWPHTFGPGSGGRDVGLWPFDESKVRRMEVDA